MKYNHYFFSILCFLSPLSHAMKRAEELSIVEKKVDILGEITAVKSPSCVRTLGEKCILSGWDANMYTCSLVDPIKDKEIKNFNSYFSLGLDISPEVSPNNKRVVLFSDNKLILYNAKKNREELIVTEPDLIQSVAFSPHEKAILVCYGHAGAIAKYNYKTKTRNDIQVNNHIDNHSEIIAMHPKEKVISIARKQNLCVYQYNVESDCLEKKITLPIGSYSVFCKYSSDGSYIAVGDKRNISILDPKQKNDDNDDDDWYRLEIKGSSNTWFEHVAFHPNGLVIATISQTFIWSRPVYKKQEISFWDIVSRQRMCTLSGSDLDGDLNDTHDFDFYRGGSEILVTVRGKCLRIKVPFEVIYESDAKEKCLYALCVLNHIRDRSTLPQDIGYHCVRTLLEKCKR